MAHVAYGIDGDRRGQGTGHRHVEIGEEIADEEREHKGEY